MFQFKRIAAVSLLAWWAIALAFGQSQQIRAKIEHDFKAGGKLLPAAQYTFVAVPGGNYIIVTGDKVTVRLPVLTRLAAQMHTSPKDVHIVFDKVGETRHLAELWMSTGDGFLLRSTKERHQHEVVDIGK